MESNDEQFFLELRDHFLAIKALAAKYGYADEFSMALVAGLYIETEEGDGAFRMMSDFYVAGEEELDEILSQATHVFQEQMRQYRAEEEEGYEGPSWLDASTQKDWGIDDWLDFIGKNKDNDE